MNKCLHTMTVGVRTSRSRHARNFKENKILFCLHSKLDLLYI